MEFTNILLRYGEIFLKGKNRRFFEKKLLQNLQAIAGEKPVQLRMRALLPYFENHHKIKKVFGLISYSPVIEVKKDSLDITKAALNIVLKQGYEAFKVETKRSDKQFPIKSPEMNVLVGKYIEENSKSVFDFSSKNKVYIEIGQEKCFVFSEIISCYGGLPTGVEGSVVLFVDDSASLLAGLLLMKRGVLVYPVSLCKKSISLLQEYSPSKLTLKVISDLSKVEEYAIAKNCSMVVVGDTFENKKEYEFENIVLRPLIGFSKKEVTKALENYS